VLAQCATAGDSTGTTIDSIQLSPFCSGILSRRALHLELWVGTVTCVATDTVEMCDRNRVKKTVTKRKRIALGNKKKQ